VSGGTGLVVRAPTAPSSARPSRARPPRAAAVRCGEAAPDDGRPDLLLDIGHHGREAVAVAHDMRIRGKPTWPRSRSVADAWQDRRVWATRLSPG
jgi:hypothetical protein